MPLPHGSRITVLAPLTGPNADVGRSLLRAAHLALDPPGGPPFDERDTKGTPDGAAAAATAALAAGDGIVVGPLTAGETDAVARVVRPGNVPVLAFSSDTREARAGVWPMGITPAQQVRTLMRAVQTDHRANIAAVLPRNSFGDALADGLAQATAEVGLPPAHVVRYEAGTAALAGALDQLAAPGSPPVDALLLGTTLEATIAALPTLKRDGLGPDRVRLLGTALWARSASQMDGLTGAWFAGPDQAALHTFEQNYMRKFGMAPKPLDSIGYDAAAAARAVSSGGVVNVNLLLAPVGFSGANGVFVFLPDGRVRRALALFEIGPGGALPRGIPAEPPAM